MFKLIVNYSNYMTSLNERFSHGRYLCNEVASEYSFFSQLQAVRGSLKKFATRSGLATSASFALHLSSAGSAAVADLTVSKQPGTSY